MYRITQAALDWYASKYADDTEAKAAIFAAIEAARAAHLTRLPVGRQRVPPLAACLPTGRC
jgi:hypothetical protein